MTKRDRHILDEFARRVREAFPTAELRAFGSRAAGRASPDSDMDVCVVLPTLDEEADHRVMGVAWEVGFANDVVISTVTFSRDEFSQGPLSCSPLVLEIQRHGVAA
jgi:DNA polymerase sigma